MTGKINVFCRKLTGGFLPFGTPFNPQSNCETSAPRKIYEKSQNIYRKIKCLCDASQHGDARNSVYFNMNSKSQEIRVSSVRTSEFKTLYYFERKYFRLPKAHRSFAAENLPLRDSRYRRRCTIGLARPPVATVCRPNRGYERLDRTLTVVTYTTAVKTPGLLV